MVSWVYFFSSQFIRCKTKKNETSLCCFTSNASFIYQTGGFLPYKHLPPPLPALHSVGPPEVNLLKPLKFPEFVIVFVLSLLNVTVNPSTRRQTRVQEFYELCNSVINLQFVVLVSLSCLSHVTLSPEQSPCLLM